MEPFRYLSCSVFTPTQLLPLLLLHTLLGRTSITLPVVDAEFVWNKCFIVFGCEEFRDILTFLSFHLIRYLKVEAV